MKNIIVDLSNINSIDFNKYTQVYLVGYAKDDIKNLLEVQKNFSNVSLYLPSSNFDKAYKLINRHIADFVNNNLELLSLFKLCKQDLFDIGMIMVALKNDHPSVYILTQYNCYLEELQIVNNKKLLKSSLKKINYIRQFAYLSIINLKAMLLFVKSFLIKSMQVDKLLIDYYNKRVLGNFESDVNSILIDIAGSGKIINFDGFVLFLKYQRKLLKYSFKYKILNQTIFKQSYQLLRVISLVNYYNPKVVLGVLDASVQADIYSIVFKRYKIKFGCYSHGYNYNFRIDYIRIPFDFYFVWSQAHLIQIESGQYIKSDCKFYITGCPFYKDVNFRQLRDINIECKYDILVIGEYYYHNYSSQPFNSIPTIKLAQILSKYKGKYTICIRPRRKDEYYEDMHDILKNDALYSLPIDETTETATIMEDIQSSKVVISMLSGGMQDALLLHKPVIQANLIGIQEPKSFDVNNVVYYADTVKKLEKTIDNFFKGELSSLDYCKNNEYFLNKGEFNIEKVKQVISEHI
jgi:hypothetical protein